MFQVKDEELFENALSSFSRNIFRVSVPFIVIALFFLAVKIIFFHSYFGIHFLIDGVSHPFEL